jgi:hypothetical protein
VIAVPNNPQVIAGMGDPFAEAAGAAFRAVQCDLRGKQFDTAATLNDTEQGTLLCSGWFRELLAPVDRL